MGQEHFKPSLVSDPQEQRRLHAHLERIDLATFEANRLVLARTIGRLDGAHMKRLASVAAAARANWVNAALVISEHGVQPDAQQVDQLALLRRTYLELSESYEAMRRMVERGYLCYLDTGEQG
jgi:hypothetical protein